MKIVSRLYHVTIYMLCYLKVKDCRKYVGKVTMLDKIIHINHFQVDIEYFGIRMLYTGEYSLSAN